MMAALISFSTSSLLREYMRRECSMMCKVLSAWLGGSSRVRGKGWGLLSPDDHVDDEVAIVHL